MLAVKLISTITCPFCGHRRTETMPTDGLPIFLRMPQLQSVDETQER
jgi:hypothetical protein